MNTPVQLKYLDAFVFMFDVAAYAMEMALQKSHRHVRGKSGKALHPGSATPFWNELAFACEARLTKYGDKVRLARVLGISRQRLHQLLVAKTACPDAERTLQLLLWLKAREKAMNPS